MYTYNTSGNSSVFSTKIYELQSNLDFNLKPINSKHIYLSII